MTLTAPKMRVHNEGPFIKTGKSAYGMDIGDFDFKYWGSGGRNGGPPVFPHLITGYYDDGSDHVVTPFSAVTHRTVNLAGATMSYDPLLYDSQVTGIAYLEAITNSFDGTCSYIGSSYLAVTMWATKSWASSHLFTRQSTNTTTKYKLYVYSSANTQSLIYLVALNGPNQGNIDVIRPAWSGVTNPYLGGIETGFFTLPEHPVGGPDKVYYGIVYVHGGIWTPDTRVFVGSTCAFASAGTDSFWSVYTVQIDKDTLLPQ